VSDKTMSEAEALSYLQSGMTIGIGGWGSRRKPMALVRALVRSDLKDLTIVSCGGPDVGMLCASEKIRTIHFAFVSPEIVPLEPYFRIAREAGIVDAIEYDEGMLVLALQAAAWHVPFLPTRVGLGSGLLESNPSLSLFTSPIADADGSAEELVAVPALRLDAALVHADRADRSGNAQFLGVDPYFDELMIEAADMAFISCDELVETSELTAGANFHSRLVSRHLVKGVVPAALGAHPTSCEPKYSVDAERLREYLASANVADGWSDYRRRWVDIAESEYRAMVGAR